MIEIVSKQTIRKGEPISLVYGGTCLNGITWTIGQSLSVKNDLSGFEFVDNLRDSKRITNIASSVENDITFGNVNYPFNLNSSNNFKINSTPSNNQILWYKNNSVTFIDENNIESTKDLWTLMNIFYPRYKYLLMNMIIQKQYDNVNLIEFIPTKYNYTFTITEITNVVIIHTVFNDSLTEFSNDIDNNDINTHYDTNTNNFTLTRTTNFNFKIACYDTQIYTLHFIKNSNWNIIR